MGGFQCLLDACLPGSVPEMAHHAEAMGSPQAPLCLRCGKLHMMSGKPPPMA